jgi:hypothetical protein
MRRDRGSEWRVGSWRLSKFFDLVVAAEALRFAVGAKDLSPDRAKIRNIQIVASREDFIWYSIYFYPSITVQRGNYNN